LYRDSSSPAFSAAVASTDFEDIANRIDPSRAPVAAIKRKKLQLRAAKN
jgi:hypothetical protein